MTYRNIAIIAKCSHGSVHQERLAQKRDEELLRLKLEAENEKIAKEKEELEKLEKQAHILPDIHEIK